MISGSDESTEQATPAPGEMTATLHFDDYGAKRAMYSTTNTTAGRHQLTIHEVEIEADG